MTQSRDSIEENTPDRRRSCASKILGALPGTGWVWGASILTICYLGYAYMYLWPQPVIGPCLPGRVTAFDVCLTPNEVGDLFAGLFAPIAFIWLAAAVLVQAQELNAQREELKLTRKEMKSQRGVWEAQLEETRAQTRALVIEGDERRQSHADRQLDVLLEGITRAVASNANTLSFVASWPSDDAGGEFEHRIEIKYFPGLEDAPTDDRLLALSLEATRIMSFPHFKRIIHADPVDRAMFDLVLKAMDIIDVIRPDITEAAVVRLDVIMYEKLEMAVRRIAKAIDR